MSSDEGSVAGRAVASQRVGTTKENGDKGGECEESGNWPRVRGNIGANSSHESVVLSPGFRSAAAMAGWDDETLMLAALNQSPSVSSGPQMVENCNAPCEVLDSPACRDRKRDKRTPLSSARRHRRIRWHGINGSPLVRVPMRALPLVSDNEKSNDAEEESCRFLSGGTKDKENVNPGSASLGNKNLELKGKLKEKTPTKPPPYMNQLREELSCAVCLDICFEPSTISCGHSFCGTCLQSVLKMCGPKCPKCRQPLRSETLRSCRTNTVLWNTIQILFPQECAAKLADKQKQQEQEEEAANSAKNCSSSLGLRPNRLQPWRSSSSAFSSTVNRISVMGTLRSSFQAAAQFIGDDTDVGLTRRSEDEVRQGSSTGSAISQQEMVSQRSQSRSGRIRRARQEQVDAALAARLQQAELMMGSPKEDVSAEEPRRGAYSRSWNHNQPRYGGTVALAAANLRTVASRATRHRSRPQS